MPQYPRVAVNFQTPSDQYVFPVRPHEHRIAVYPAARLEVLRAWYNSRPDGADKANQLSAELSTFKIREAEQFRREHRNVEAIGAAREAIAAKKSPQAVELLRELIDLQSRLEVRYASAEREFASRNTPAAIELLEGVLKEKPNWAQARGKLGTLYAMAGDRSRAASELQAVGRYDPDDAYGHNMLGWLAYLDGNGDEAVSHFRRAEEIQPFTAEINHRWGLALLLVNRWAEAEKRLRIAIEVAPNHAGSYQALSIATRKQDRHDEAIRNARLAARLTRNANPDVLLTLADAYSAANRHGDAIGVANEALALAMKETPELVPQIRIRVGEIQRHRK